eukprot:TRINITY_DN2273_c0_g2_i3.p1 TRINITY_DN2273_c0_g2~~TRINITY_DN2273_c0_g2_i3.p1  ORF type:complete len:366 (+),score=50.10 TRINITY_DN2273_c0_g2_i3:78-1175(+)
MALAEASSAPRYVAIGKQLADVADDKFLMAPPGLCENLSATPCSSSSSRVVPAERVSVKKQNSDSLSDTTIGAAVDTKCSDAESDGESSPEGYSAKHMDMGFMRSGYMQDGINGRMFPDAQQWPSYDFDDASFHMANVGGEPYSSMPGSMVEQLISLNAQLLAQNQLLWKTRLGSPWPSNSVPAPAATQARNKAKLSSKLRAQNQEVPIDQRTTMMLRNLPNNFTRDMLKRMLDDSGFFGLYNFLYLPIDFQSRAALGYAFVNLLDTADVPHFWTTFQGYSSWPLPSKKVCKVSWSDPHQGLQSQVDLYRDSPVMHESVPDEFRPICLADGVRIPFPEPNKPPRAPRFRRSGGQHAQRRAARSTA